jgi:L-threonylcarbamoyladenylate synthase
MAYPQRFSVNKTLDAGILARAVEVIRAGQIVILPTDTAYAFAANAVDEEAIARVFALKNRNLDKAFHMICCDMGMTERYAETSPEARLLARVFLPGALTLVMPRKETVPESLVGGLATVGVRMPDNPWCLELARQAGVPVTATSANLSGMPTPYDVLTIESQLGARMQEIALVLDQGALEKKLPSTLVDVTVRPPRILRPGPVTAEQIEAALKTA